MRNKKASITLSILTLIVTLSAILFTDSHIALKSIYALGFILALYSLLIIFKRK